MSPFAKKHAVALATVAVTLPHGERDDIVDVLIQTAERGPRQVLLTNLVRSGQMIDVEVVKGGLDEVLEAAEKEPWLLNEGGEFFNWLMLIPFTNGLSETIAIVQSLAEQHRTLEVQSAIVEALTCVPGDEAEDLLFDIAETEPRLYALPNAWSN